MAPKKEKSKTSAKTVDAESGGNSLLDDLLTEAKFEPSDEGYSDVRSAVDYVIRQSVSSSENYRKIDKLAIERMIAEIDGKISVQLNEVLHHDEFKKLESAWRGLEYMVDRVDFSQDIRIGVLNASKDDLVDDFEDASLVTQSNLYHRVYTKELGTYGGKPYGLICANYEFGCGAEDIQLLRQFSAIGAMAHAPFIANTSPTFFGRDKKDFFDLPKIRELDTLFEMPQYARWRSFRESEDSRNVGLCMPRFLLRLPYGETGKRVRSFDFEEDVAGKPENYCWGNSSMAFATRVADSFAKYRWCPNIIGPKSGGTVGDLPKPEMPSAAGKEHDIPVEVQISDRREWELAGQGFIPLVFQKETDRACFFSANSVQKPKVFRDDEQGKVDQLNYELGTKLPYMFIISRIAHHLKIRQRELLGGDMDRGQLERELNEWIQQYVVNMNNPSKRVRQRKPLREANVSVEEIPGHPGRYRSHLKIRPHFQYQQANFTLSLVGKIDE